MTGIRKRLSPFALLACISTAAVAQDVAQQEAQCRDNGAEFELRMAACDALVAGGAHTNQPWLFERRGDAWEDAGNYDAAIADYRRALEIEPEYLKAHQGLVISNVLAERPEAALAASEALPRLDPDGAFSAYWRGRALQEAGQTEAAIAAFEHARALDADYFWPSWQLGAIHTEAGDHAAALTAYEAALALKPFRAGTYRQIGRVQEQLGRRDLLARNNRIALAIDPRLDRYVSSIPDLTPRVETPTLPPLAWQPPQAGLALEFLDVILPRDTRPEMELAIMAIAAWFSAPEKAVPEAMMFLTRRLTADGDTVRIGLEVGAEENFERFLGPGVIMPAEIGTYRGLMLKEVRPRGPDGPVFRVVHDGPQPAELWPLAVGRELAGQGRVMLVCPDSFQFESMVLGCRIGMESVEMGTLDYSFVVDRVEQVQVPLGDFTTFVLRYRELARSEIGGREQMRELETHWWVAPELNFWVKRTKQQGDKIATALAVRRLDP